MTTSTETLNKFYGLFLNERGTSILANHMIMKELIVALTDSDLDSIQISQTFFNPVPSPAARSKINQSLPAGANVITIDTNAIVSYSSREAAAIILHEIGHALYPHLVGMLGEYTADDYAVERGFGPEIITSLQSGIANDPKNYANQSTDLRIDRISNLPPG